MHFRLLAPLLLAAVALLAGPACTDACMQVQQAICTCSGQTQTEQTACSDAASAQESLEPPTSEELTACKTLVTTCDQFLTDHGCVNLQTEAGRKACGIAK
jgi:hypothetical protein